jgi:hypothetical protein
VGFKNPLGLLALLGIPIIILLYMLRPKNNPIKIPSLYLWEQARIEIESAAKFHKLKTSILMYLQIVAVILIALLLAGLFIFSNKGAKDVVIVIDCTVSMQSTDVEPTRMASAKEEAINYVNALSDGASMTLITLKDIPEVLMTQETNKSRVVNAIHSLSPVDAYADMSLVGQVIVASQANEETQVIYFGDKVIDGVTNIRIGENTNNYGVGGISYTVYEKEGLISVLVNIYNQGEMSEMIPVSIYADSALFAAKQIEVGPQDSAKLIFTEIPSDVNEIKVQIDREDDLAVDNTATTFVAQTRTNKAVLVTDGNIFLEKILKISQQTELYIAGKEDINTLEGYDLYIFDSMLPEVLPSDGALLLFNPPDSETIMSKGYVENQPYFLGDHEVTNHIDNPEFLIGLTKVYETPIWGESLINIGNDSCAFAGVLDGKRMVVYGFDIHNTDLPLCVEFPILMIKTLDYLVPTTMIERTNISAGETLGIKIFPDTKAAYVIDPNNKKLSLDIYQGESQYNSTYTSGIYEIIQETSEGEVTQNFAVNTSLFKDVQATTNTETANQGANPARQSLSIIIGILLLIIIVMEWFIYNYRRKINEIRL